LTGQDRCFVGTGRSTTFIGPAEQDAPVQLEFGSGTIVAAVASDVVEVGGVEAQMKNGLLLMVQSALDITEPLEGILGLGRPRPKKQEAEVSLVSDSATATIPSFLETAGISRFSVCLNGGGNQPGVLRLGTPKLENAMGSVGQMHWGMDFRGFSVGDVSAPVAFCTSDSMLPGQ
jgi:hypothetical protein